MQRSKSEHLPEIQDTSASQQMPKESESCCNFKALRPLLIGRGTLTPPIYFLALLFGNIELRRRVWRLKNSTLRTPIYFFGKHADMRACDEREFDGHSLRVCARELSIARSHRADHTNRRRVGILRWWRTHPPPPPSVATRASNRVGNAKMCHFCGASSNI